MLSVYPITTMLEFILAVYDCEKWRSELIEIRDFDGIP